LGVKRRRTASVTGDRFLLVKGTAGMGNRMLAAAAAVLYARLSGRRLIVDWSDATYSSDGANAFHRFFRSPACEPADRVPETDDVVPSFWRGRLHESVREVTVPFPGSRYPDSVLEKRSRLDLTRLDHPEAVAVLWAYVAQLHVLRPHLADRLPDLARLTNAELLRTIFRDDLLLQPEIRERVREFRAVHLRGPTVGVHVRYGDYRVSLRAVLGKLAELVRGEPGLQVFLATDNSEVLRTVERLYRNVVTTPHRYGTPGVPLHNDPDCPDRTAGGIEALVDMYVLAECDYLVVDTSSSFAAVAALLGTRPSSAVFNVKRRSRKQSRPRRRLLYALWLRAGLFSRVPRLLGRLVSLTTR